MISDLELEIENDSGISRDLEKSFDQETCRICLDEMKSNENLYRAPCVHKFHRMCLERWLEECRRCPVCNGQVHLITSADKTLAQVPLVTTWLNWLQ